MSEASSQKTVRFGVVACLMAAVVIGLGMISSRAENPQSDGPQLMHTVRRGNVLVTVTEQGVLESSDNTEIKCKVRGQNTVIWVIENGTVVQPGEVLCRLDTLEIEDAINERSKYAHWSRSAAENSQAQVARAKLAIDEYLKGRFISQLMTLEKDLAIAKSRRTTATNMLAHALRMRERGYVSALDVEQKEFALEQAKLDVEVKETEKRVLKEYTKKIELETLHGNLNAAMATHDANVERAELDETRRDIAVEEFKHCVVKADKAGLVIYPSAAAWKDAPDIAEGATVHKDQILLLMPDLSQMQVKVGVHESIVDRIEEGLYARVDLPEQSLDGSVMTVASVARPAGWWTGNVVKYDTIIDLPSIEGLRPGMSAEVEIVIARHEDVLNIPVSAILETDQETLCWVKTDSAPERRKLLLGDSNDVFVVVHEGLSEGEQVVLNPTAFIREAQEEALQSVDSGSESSSGQQESTSSNRRQQQTLPAE